MSTPAKGRLVGLFSVVVVLSVAPRALAERPAIVAKPTTAPALASVILQQAPVASAKPLRVLFIGNSYTFFNGGMGTLVCCSRFTEGIPAPFRPSSFRHNFRIDEGGCRVEALLRHFPGAFRRSCCLGQPAYGIVDAPGE